ncbi:IS3 family transposase [Ruegeria sp. 2012CJ41-6]|uniref:IS3 family transposase n=1 Tax=Ruegeria spongiae TaxID=2942209 RepID=A0ABT0Q896_9RHOB|nr:IS3 family transposase [Ruegeria spongiae]MCL6286106.1 IS3 family transposase [Ruegeria spongiae]
MSDVMDRHSSSERRACVPADLHSSVFQYKKQGQCDDALRKRLRELSNERRRFGYRRLGIPLAREGFEVNQKKLFRLYRENMGDVPPPRRSFKFISDGSFILLLNAQNHGKNETGPANQAS